MMTVREVIEQVKKTLGNINVPVALIQSIGVPIMQSIHALDVVIQTWDEQKKESEPHETVLHSASEDEVQEEVRNNG